jgi:signal transduction histidine kinase/ligand-binding sensor domain-containing protein/CheY-like chemotaxis protein
MRGLLRGFGGKRRGRPSPSPSEHSTPEGRRDAERSGRGDVAAFARLVPCVYATRDGLPVDSIIALASDARGYLWIGTYQGAVRYNGRVWTVVPMPNTQASNEVAAIHAATDGSMWFGTSGGGLHRLLGDAWTSFDRSSGLSGNRVHCIASGNGGKGLWVGTDGGAAYLADQDSKAWRTYDTTSGLPANNVTAVLETERLARGRGRTVWFGTNGGLARFDGDTWTYFDTSSGLPSNRILCLMSARAPGSDSESVLWVGTEGGGLARFDGQSWVTYDSSSGLPSDSVWRLLETDGPDGESVLWIGTAGSGLAMMVAGRVRRILDESSGLPNNSIRRLLATGYPGGRQFVWVGTNGGGLARLSSDGWRVYDTSSGLPHDCVSSILETSSPSERCLWLGTDRGLARLAASDGGAWQVYDTSSGLPHHSIWSLLETARPGGGPGRSVWAGTDGGLARLDGDVWRVFDTSNHLPHNSIWCLLATRGSTDELLVWIGTNEGLVRFAESDGGSWRTYNMSTGLPNNRVLSLLETRGEEDARSAVWVGTYGGGLARCGDSDAGEWQIFDTSSGLPNDSVWSLLATRNPERPSDTTLWVGTAGGLAFCPVDRIGGSWTVLSATSKPALPDNTIYSLRSDDRGRIYATTSKGVARLTPRTPTRDDPSHFSIYTFLTEDGLPNIDCINGASATDGSGRIWVGTVGGAAVFDPAHEIEDLAPKPLYVERVLVRGEPRALDEDATLSHSENELEFEYALLSYFRDGDTCFRSQLAGFDRAPSAWGAEYRRTYTNLPAGGYCFRVWGRDYAGNVSGPVEVSFRINPAPWKTWWAYTLYAGAAAGAAYAGLRYRVHALERRGEELEALVEQRTAELSESEQRALDANRAKSVFLANMSHELRTPLNAVLGFAQLLERSSRLGSDERAKLDVILRSGEHLLGLINDVLSISKIEAGRHSLVEQPFDLRALLGSVERIIRLRADAKGLDVVVTVESALPSAATGDEGKLRQVLLNLLGNAVKFTERGGIELRVAWSDGRCAFEVEDTGHGIAAEEIASLFEPFVQTESGRNATEGTGLGLAISRQIVRLMGGDILVRSAIGRGTTFRFEIDLPQHEAPLRRHRTGRVVAVVAPREAPRVLIVDDVQENRLLLVSLLSTLGFLVREAANGLEAVAQWAAWHPHLILMDMRMPVMGGIEVTQRIRAAERAGTRGVGSEERGEGSSAEVGSAESASRPMPRSPLPTKIVALTASAFEHERDAILACGADDFLAKPFRERTLLETLARHLGLELVYEDAVKLQAPPERTGEDALTRERLAAVPAELFARLREAVGTGDVEEAACIASAIGEVDDALGAALLAAIGGFRLETLFDLLNPADASS